MRSFDDGGWLASENLRACRVDISSAESLKRDAYLALGVREVWIVDWRERVVEVTKTRGHFRRARGEIRWRPPGLEPVSISLDEVFEDLGGALPETDD